MLTLQWSLTGAALLLGVVAWLRARRASRRLERLTESYWELRYEYGQLRARITALEPPTADAGQDPPSQQPAGTTAFVPLSSIKR